MKKSLYIGIPVVIIILIIIYFVSNPVSNRSITENESDPQHGGTIVIGISNDVESLNPLYGESATARDITHLLLLGLADLDENSNFKPELASSWEYSQDNLKLTYKLRKDIHWSDGVAITADDVKFTYDLLMDDKVASPRQGVTEFIKEVVVADPHTVTFVFTEAYPNQLFDTAGEIVPRHILEEVDRSSLRTHLFARNPVSSGPFKLNKWVSAQYLELVPNPLYFQDRPYLDRIVFKIVPDKTNQLMQIKSGEIDMMTGVPPAQVRDLSQENPNLNIHHVDGRVYYYIAYNQKNDLFSNTAVRTALTMTINRHKLIEAILYGYGRPCLGPIAPMTRWAYNENVSDIPYDPEEAKNILKNEGWSDTDGDGWLDKNGKIFEFALKTSVGNQVKSDVCVIAQEQLAKIGIKVNVEKVEWTSLVKQLQSKDFDACVNGWSTSYYIDPTPIFHSSSTDLFNFISYNNPEIDRLIESGRVEMDRSKSAEIWKNFHELVYKDQPYTFLFWIDKAVAVNGRIKNAMPIALSPVYNLENWYINDDNLAQSNL